MTPNQVLTIVDKRLEKMEKSIESQGKDIKEINARLNIMSNWTTRKDAEEITLNRIEAKSSKDSVSKTNYLNVAAAIIMTICAVIMAVKSFF